MNSKGEDPNCSGFFYSCGYNSAGMMLGGGCGEQIAHWIINGRPDKYMFNYDIRRWNLSFLFFLFQSYLIILILLILYLYLYLIHRFLPEQRNNMVWIHERSHEAYAKNYSIIFPHDEPLSGRNLKVDPFHSVR